MDLSTFFAVYRRGGGGRAALGPALVVSLLLLAYARGERPSRGVGGQGGVRAVDDGVASALRLCEGRALIAGDRAQVRGGCRLPGDRRPAEARSRDDREVPCPPRGRAGEAVQLCALAVQAGGVGEGRGARDRRNEGPCQ